MHFSRKSRAGRMQTRGIPSDKQIRQSVFVRALERLRSQRVAWVVLPGYRTDTKSAKTRSGIATADSYLCREGTRHIKALCSAPHSSLPEAASTRVTPTGYAPVHSNQAPVRAGVDRLVLTEHAGVREEGKHARRRIRRREPVGGHERVHGECPWIRSVRLVNENVNASDGGSEGSGGGEGAQRARGELRVTARGREEGVSELIHGRCGAIGAVDATTPCSGYVGTVRHQAGWRA